jgi:hypothetical protein
MVPTASQGEPVAAATGAASRSTCRWEGETLDDSASLVVTVTALPISLAEMKAALDAEARDSGNEKISGVGSVAFIKSVIPGDAEATVLVGKLLLNVDYSSSFTATRTARDRQDEVVALAKAAAGRM